MIIVNYNVKYFLEQCLCSVLKACSNIEAEIFVFDNNSTDGSRDYFTNRFSSVNFRWNQVNIGFAKANNKMLQEATGDYILFLNPDTIVPEDCFEKCISFFKTKKDCGAVGVHMIDGSGKFLKESKRSFPSVSASFFKITGFATLFPSSKSFAKYYAGHLNETENGIVDVLAGAFLMVSREALNIVKGFDEDFFMYGEDIDLSYRLQKAAFHNYYFSGASIIHFKGESTQKSSMDYSRRFYSAMQTFVTKHYKERKLLAFFIVISIRLSRLLASVKTFLIKLFRRPERHGSSMNIAIAAGQQKFDEVIRLIKYSPVPVVIKGRIAVAENDKGFSIGKMENTEKLINEFSIDQLVFCEGEMSNRFIFEKVKALAGKTNFLFHGNDTSSIVGSSDKNSNGIFIAIH